jgi:hypothetical protein
MPNCSRILSYENEEENHTGRRYYELLQKYSNKTRSVRKSRREKNPICIFKFKCS